MHGASFAGNTVPVLNQLAAYYEDQLRAAMAG
jgi:hypothetical protein